MAAAAPRNSVPAVRAAALMETQCKGEGAHQHGAYVQWLFWCSRLCHAHCALGGALGWRSALRTGFGV